MVTMMMTMQKWIQKSFGGVDDDDNNDAKGYLKTCCC